jgi:hypothetical protein
MVREITPIFEEKYQFLMGGGGCHLIPTKI